MSKPDAAQSIPFVISARVAGRLHGVLAAANDITLSASNAKGIAARGGDKTMGFRPITDFVNEMANDTIALVSRINHVALDISITSVNKLRTEDARRRFSLVADSNETDRSGERLAAILADLDRRILEFTRHQRERISQLSELFGEIEQRTRAAKIIATSSRSEASRAGEFQPYLESIADNVEQASDTIRRDITACRQHLSTLAESMLRS